MELPIDNLYNVFDSYKRMKIVNPYRFGGTEVDLKNGLVSHWELNETGANVAYDAVSTNHGSITGAAVEQPSVARGYDFDGADDYIDTTLSTEYSVRSISAWIYLSGFGENNYGRIVDKGSNFIFYVDDTSGIGNGIRFQQSFSTTNGQWGVDSVISLNTWYHVVLVYDNSSDTNDAKIYIDGVEQTLSEDITPSGTATTNSNNYYFGNNEATTRTFDGTIDQPAIWSKALTQSEITQLYNSGHGLKYDYFDTGLKTNLVSLWELDETTGTTVTDSHGSNDGTNNGATVEAQGIVSNLEKCFSFDGTSDFISIPYSSDFSIGDGAGNDNAFSIAFWIEPDVVASNQGILAKDDGSNYDWAVITRGSSSQILFRLYGYDGSTNSLDLESSTVLSTSGGWYHVVITYDGTKALTGLNIYINGSLDNGDKSENGTYIGSGDINTSLGIATWGPGNYYDGKIDQPAIWSRALTSSEISQIYNSGNGLNFTEWDSGLENGLVSLWKLDEDATAATAYDSHGNNDGTITGATINQTGKVGKCYDFDGVDDYVETTLQTDFTTYSFSAWIYADGWGEGNNGRVITNNVITFWIHGTYGLIFQQQFLTNTGTWYNLSFSLNQWNHMVATYDNSSDSNVPSVYLNGSAVSLTELNTPSGTPTPSSIPYYIGNNDIGTRTFNGKIDEVMIYNRILTQAEVTALYNSGNGLSYADL